MKTNKFHIVTFLLLIFLSGCFSNKIKYNKLKIEEKYVKENYIVTLNIKEVDFENIYLDKKNIELVKRNRKEKRINIYQKKETSLEKLEFLESDSINFEDISMIIIDGLPTRNDDPEKIIIEPSAIESFEVLKRDTLNNNIFCKRPNGDVLLIVTK